MSDQRQALIAPARNRYAGDPAELMARLRPEAYRLAATINGDELPWAWAVFPDGLFVGVRVRGDAQMRKEVRIARQERPETAEQEKRWQQEVATFRRHLGIEGWHELPPHDDDRKFAAVRYLELRGGETEPGYTRCVCGKRIRWEPEYAPDGNRCQQCAFAAGAEYEAMLERERTGS